MEHCSIVYYWRNLDRTYKLNRLFQDSTELAESYGEDWNDFLNHMAQERWELTGAVSLVNSNISGETIVYFKRRRAS